MQLACGGASVSAGGTGRLTSRCTSARRASSTTWPMSPPTRRSPPTADSPGPGTGWWFWSVSARRFATRSLGMLCLALLRLMYTDVHANTDSHIHMYTCTRSHIHAVLSGTHSYTLIHVHTHTYAHTHMHKCMHIRTYTGTTHRPTHIYSKNTHARTYSHSCICMHIQLCTHIDICTYSTLTHTHTCICTYTPTFTQMHYVYAPGNTLTGRTEQTHSPATRRKSCQNISGSLAELLRF